MTVRIIQGDCREQLRELGAGAVQCVVTSPPYFGLRDYGHDDQVGLEDTPAEYVTAMVEIFREVRRVLADDGTLWLNLGDTYIGGRNGGIGPHSQITSQRNHAAARAVWTKQGGRTHRTCPGFKPKDMVGAPWRVALALQADGWWLRSEIIWHKPSPMPERVSDRPTRAHEHVFLLSKSARYYYDHEAIREPSVTYGERHEGRSGGRDGSPTKRGFDKRVCNETRNRRSVWTIPQEPFTEAHFATFPTKLVEPCILAGCPRGGTVLDPFAGAGTTGLVADRLGRDAILIELNGDYCDMARRRIEDDAPLLGPVVMKTQEPK